MTGYIMPNAHVNYLKRNNLLLYKIYEPGETRNYLKKKMQEEGIDYWLMCDGSNMNNLLSRKVLGTRNTKVVHGPIMSPHFAFIHPDKKPILVASELDARNAAYFKKFGELIVYSDRESKNDILKKLFSGTKKIAIEYSRTLPSISRVDAGHVDLIREELTPKKCDIVSSGDLITFVEGLLSELEYKLHKKAAKNLCKIMQEAFEFIRDKINAKRKVTEWQVAKFINKRYTDLKMEFDEGWGAIVGVNENPVNPHYFPTTKRYSPIKKGDLVLIDIYAKQKNPRGIWADITWMGYVGESIPQNYADVFSLIADGRDASVSLARERFARNKPVQGRELDLVAREVIEKGKGSLLHGTGGCTHEVGHSMAHEDHAMSTGPSAYKYQDHREFIPGLLFTIEPGYYVKGKYGMRTEIDVYLKKKGKITVPEITTAVQDEIVPILSTNLKKYFKWESF